MEIHYNKFELSLRGIILIEIVKSVDIPVVAIGGITQENAHELNDCGIDGLSVVSAIMEAKNPKIASENLLKEFKAKNS